jgi:hypothetical protein
MSTTSTAVLFGIDYRDSAGALAHVTPADIKSFQGGKSFAVEYIGVAQGQGNNALTAANASALESAGLSIISVYENRPSSGGGMTDTASNGTYTSAWVDYFSHPGQGTTDAQNAISGANSAGQLTGAIYFAIDLDPAKSTDPATGLNRISEATALNLIDKYFEDISAFFNSYNQTHGTSYQIGVYGAGDTLSKIVNDPLVTADGSHAFTWLAGATAWAGSKTFATWDIQQSNNDQFQLDGRNVDLDQTSGGPFGEWGIAAQTIQNNYFGITRGSLPSDQAVAVAASINAGTQTETQYVNGLLSQVTGTSIPAVAVEGSMYGAVGTSAEITSLATQFLPSQVTFAMQHGFNPQIVATEALGLVFAFGNESGSTAFASNFGPSNPATPNSTAGDATFAAAAATAIYGTASTSNLVNVLDGWVANWKAFYTEFGLPGLPNASVSQIDLAARGAAWGDAVGVALSSNIGPLNAQATNFLEDAAQGTAIYAAALGAQPNHAVFQGATFSASTTLTSSSVQLTGVAPDFGHTLV